MARLVLVGFDSHWLKNWRESFKPIIKRSNCNHVITFDSRLRSVHFEFENCSNDLVRWVRQSNLKAQETNFFGWIFRLFCPLLMK